MHDFKDKVAVITGGANGIGLDIARALADEGCHCVIADLDQSACDAAAQTVAARGVKALGKACDVTDKGHITALADFAWAQFGRVDALFNNAGVGGANGPSWKVDEKDVRWVFEVNFFGNWNCCMEFAGRFVAQGSPAHICNTASENALGWPFPYMAAYNATKAAVMGYSGMLRDELPAHVSVSLLCPGATQTNIGNSPTLRPEKYGGPQPARTGGVSDFGYPVETVGAHTVAQIKDGAFFIVPHYAARHLAEERHAEIIAAFDAQTAWSQDWEKHDTRRYAQKMQAEAKAAKKATSQQPETE